jgi:hypothetical protein
MSGSNEEAFCVFCASLRLNSFVAPSHDKVRLSSKPCDFPRVLLDFSSENTWHLSCCLLVSASLSPSCAGTWHEEKKAEMIKLLRKGLLVMAMLGVVSAGAFAQRKDQDKRPPKEPVKVITNDRKDQRPPRQNTNQPPPKDNRRRPD